MSFRTRNFLTPRTDRCRANGGKEGSFKELSIGAFHKFFLEAKFLIDTEVKIG